ncbi:Csu type fimbrial protein [Candidatus Methylocalor cossyra]|uniref:Sigma-fimbriae tip adhesin n=1 Tax=Candidatus Methylocalor cossyra TaxID=3108543 RepID=A0ABM9NFT8_9GAMM
MSTPTRVSTTPLQTQGIALALVMTALALVGRSASAATATTTLNVSATVAQDCSITTTPLAFGNYMPATAHSVTALTGTATVTIACTAGTTTGGQNGPTIGLDLGSHASGPTRNMQRDTGTEVLAYELYQPNDNTPGTGCPAVGSGTVWGTTGSNLFTTTIPNALTGRTYTICGVVPPGQDKPAGNYTDVVNATVNF